MQSPPAELHDIPDPQPWLPGIEVPLWFWFVLVAVAASLISAVLYFVLRKQTTSAPPSGSFFEEARRALADLRESLSDRPLAEVATDASLILRRYLAGSLNEPALYETHEEFVMRDDALDTLPAGARDRLGPLLTRLAEYKYGPSRQDDDLASKLLDNSLEVLQGLESTQERAIA